MEDPILLLELLHEVLGEENAHYPNKGQISFDCPVCSHEIKGLNKGDGKGNFDYSTKVELGHVQKHMKLTVL